MYFLKEIITARILSTREGNIYTWECLSVHIAGLAGGYPIPGLAGGGTPSQVWPGGTPSLVQVPPPRPGLDGVPPPRPGTRVPPSRTWDGVAPPQTWDQVPSRTWDWVLPPPDLGPGTPPPPQHSEEHLIRGGRYASCVHAGGLSCS